MFQVFSDEDEEVDKEIEARIFSIDFELRSYKELEELQYQGKADQVWKIVKKHLGNDRLVKYIHAYRQVQTKLNNAFTAIEENDLTKLKSMLDVELIQSRDPKVFSDEDEEVDKEIEARIFSIDFELRSYKELEELQYQGKADQVWKIVKKHLGNDRLVKYIHAYRQVQRHEIVEYIAQSFPKYLNIVDHVGRSAAHYAASAKNAIYDTLFDAGADVNFPDKDGYTASRYRNNPEHIVRPISNASGLTSSPIMMKRISMDDPSFDQ
uniref:Uncharacterized protein n=1 Tax=Panagrolaimus sp. PS1159 TaxID=55785 RepID=A0AC35FET6_9BILA